MERQQNIQNPMLSQDKRNLNEQIVKLKIANGLPANKEEHAAAILNSRHLLFNFLMDNNLQNIAVTLKSKLGEPLDFRPSREQIEAVIKMYIAKGEYRKLQTILDNFKKNENANNYTTDPEFLATLKNEAVAIRGKDNARRLNEGRR